MNWLRAWLPAMDTKISHRTTRAVLEGLLLVAAGVALGPGEEGGKDRRHTHEDGKPATPAARAARMTWLAASMSLIASPPRPARTGATPTARQTQPAISSGRRRRGKALRQGAEQESEAERDRCRGQERSRPWRCQRPPRSVASGSTRSRSGRLAALVGHPAEEVVGVAPPFVLGDSGGDRLRSASVVSTTRPARRPRHAGRRPRSPTCRWPPFAARPRADASRRHLKRGRTPPRSR